MGDRDTRWQGDNSAPLEGNRELTVDPGRRVVSERIAEAEQAARQSRDVPKPREIHPLRRWK